MNKVLVTGLGISKELGLCASCQMDYSWLINNTSTLLWADKICIPKSSFEYQINQHESKSEKVISMFLNIAEQNGLIDKINLSEMYNDNEGESIYKKVLLDSENLVHTFPNTVKKMERGVPDEIEIEGQGYCGAWLSSVYAGMRIAKDIDANCLFSEKEHVFLKYLYGLDIKKHHGIGINSVYNEIFSIYIPESVNVHNYAFVDEESCKACVSHKKCKRNYLKQSEDSINKILKWRDYDEIQQAKNTIEKLIKSKNQIVSNNDVADVIKEFKEKQNQINKNINKRFPKIERWTKIITVMATPITIASAITGNMPLTVGAAVATGVAQGIDNYMDIYKSKNNWVGFVNDLK